MQKAAAAILCLPLMGFSALLRKCSALVADSGAYALLRGRRQRRCAGMRFADPLTSDKAAQVRSAMASTMRQAVQAGAARA